MLTNYLRRARAKRVAPFIRGDVLDLGCGSHGIANVLDHFGPRITSYCGVEMSDEAVTLLRSNYHDYRNASFLACDLDSGRLDIGRTFDCILMVALIEHLFNQKHVMSQVAALLKPEGIVVITTPTPIGNDVVHRIGSAIGLFAKAAVDDHIVIYNRLRFGIMAREVGLQVKSYRTFQFFCNQLVTLGRR